MRVFVLIFLVACGASSRQTAINAQLAATTSAAASFAKYSAQHQLDIVALSKDQASDKNALQAWRVNELELETDLAFAFQAIATELAADNATNYQAMIDAAKKFADALHTLGVL